MSVRCWRGGEWGGREREGDGVGGLGRRGIRGGRGEGGRCQQVPQAKYHAATRKLQNWSPGVKEDFNIIAKKYDPRCPPPRAAAGNVNFSARTSKRDYINHCATFSTLRFFQLSILGNCSGCSTELLWTKT